MAGPHWRSPRLTAAPGQSARRPRLRALQCPEGFMLVNGDAWFRARSEFFLTRQWSLNELWEVRTDATPRCALTAHPARHGPERSGGRAAHAAYPVGVVSSLILSRRDLDFLLYDWLD